MKLEEPKCQVRKFHEDADERKRVFKKFIAHIAGGFSEDSFEDFSYVTIRSYFEKYPDEWKLEEFEKSKRNSKKFWELIGIEQSNGKCLGNSKSWIYNMINRFDWTDRVKVTSSVDSNVSVKVISYKDEDEKKSSPEKKLPCEDVEI